MYKRFFTFSLIIAFVFISKAFFADTYAFLWNDLGINLYKKIDSWIWNMETGNYYYELRGQKPSWSIEDEFNKMLAIKWYWDCKVSQHISNADFEKIATGDIWLLSEKLSSECWDWGQRFPLAIINWISQELQDFRANTLKKAQEKTKQSYNISKAWLYMDGDLQNSSFDIIQDIQDIDYIVFTQEIPYRWERYINDGWFLDFLQWIFRESNIQWQWGDDLISWLNWLELLFEEYTRSQEAQDNYSSFVQPIPRSYFRNNNQYTCQNNELMSGLSPEEIKNLLLYSSGSTHLNATGSQNNYGNIDENWLYDEDISYSDLDLAIEELWTSYQNINDDSVWKCDDIFCITKEKLNYNNDSAWKKMRSIQSIVENSNDHLKKYVNSSLIQAKMTINNFELSLRDLDLTKILSWMSFVISKKTPPILDLEKYIEEETLEEIKERKQNSKRNLFCKRLESIGLNCKRENDLSIYQRVDYEWLILQNSKELTAWEISKREKALVLYEKQQALLHDFIGTAIQRDSQINDTDGLYKQFTELERFVWNMKDYSIRLRESVRLMNEIPIHP